MTGQKVGQLARYTIDGMLDDWGVDISVPAADRRGYLDTHVPSGSTVQAVTEDNADKYREWTKVEPQWSHYNHCDAEALYFDNDHTYVYVAVVTGLRKEGYDPPGNPVNGDDHHAFMPGDIGISADREARCATRNPRADSCCFRLYGKFVDRCRGCRGYGGNGILVAVDVDHIAGTKIFEEGR